MTATPSAVGALRGAVSRFAAGAGVADPPLADVALALTEAVTNAVVHGYRDRAQPGTVKVTACHEDHELRVVVEDHGTGCAPRTDSPGLGLGIGLITALTERVEFRPASPCGTEVHMSFNC